MNMCVEVHVRAWASAKEQTSSPIRHIRGDDEQTERLPANVITRPHGVRAERTCSGAVSNVQHEAVRVLEHNVHGEEAGGDGWVPVMCGKR